MWKVSRYWNRFVYILVDLARLMIWDYTKKNKDILGDDFSSRYSRSIMTKIH